MKKRIIKNDDIINLKPNSQILHPLSTAWIDNNTQNTMCLTKFKITDNKNISTYKNYKCINNLDNYNKYMYVPPVGISSQDIIKIYEIENQDSLYTWIIKKIKNDQKPNYFTINRVLNAWIKNNLDTLKSYNNILEKIYLELLLIYLDNDIINKINDNDSYESKNINKDIKNYIDYWFDKKNPDEFDFDLLNDMIDHITIKYKTKSINKKYKN